MITFNGRVTLTVLGFGTFGGAKKGAKAFFSPLFSDILLVKLLVKAKSANF